MPRPSAPLRRAAGVADPQRPSARDDGRTCVAVEGEGLIHAIALATHGAVGRRFSLRGNCGIIHSMDRAGILALLTQHKPELQRRFGVVRLALFGSRAREQAREGSDADVLVGFDGPASSAQYFGVQFYLEDLLGCSVDLVTDKALRPQLRPFVERDAIHV